MRHCRAFTLIEIAIAVFISILLLLIAIPSLNGVLADRRLRRSLDGLNGLVREAQERSVQERKPYLLVWEEKEIALRPAEQSDGNGATPVATLARDKTHEFAINLPMALAKDPPAEWIFWPSGNCEPATISFRGSDGDWTANYSALTARPEVVSYVAR